MKHQHTTTQSEKKQEWEERFDNAWEDLTIERENDPSIGDSGTYREYDDDKLKAFIQKERERVFQEAIKRMNKDVIGENEDLYREERNKGISDWRTERETGGNEVREIARKRLAQLQAEGVDK